MHATPDQLSDGSNLQQASKKRLLLSQTGHDALFETRKCYFQVYAPVVINLRVSPPEYLIKFGNKWL